MSDTRSLNVGIPTYTGDIRQGVPSVLVQPLATGPSRATDPADVKLQELILSIRQRKGSSR